jgi:hypothetical protein
METPPTRSRLCVMVLWCCVVYEVKRGQNSGEWHPHLHMIALGRGGAQPGTTVQEWYGHHGDSFVVDVRPITAIRSKASWKSSSTR